MSDTAAEYIYNPPVKFLTNDDIADIHDTTRAIDDGRDYVVVRRVDFEQLAVAFDNYGAGRNVNGYDIFCAARRLVNNHRSERPADGDDT